MKKILFVLIAGMITHAAPAMDDNKSEPNGHNEVWEARFNRRRVQCIAGSMAALGFAGLTSSQPRIAAASSVLAAAASAASLLALFDKDDSSEITRVYNGKDHPPVVLTGNREEIDEIIKDLRETAKRKEQSKKTPEER